MPCIRRMAALCLLSAALLCVCSCGNNANPGTVEAATNSNEGNISYAPESSDPLGSYTLAGDTQPVHDPSIIRQGSTYYAFTTDVIGLPPGNYLPVRCSQDNINWTACGSIFPGAMPSWVTAKVPGIIGL